MSAKSEPVIWSRDTGQQIPCFDRCQLIITWMSNRGILVYNFCLISIRNSVSDGAKNKSVLNIDRS